LDARVPGHQFDCRFGEGRKLTGPKNSPLPIWISETSTRKTPVVFAHTRIFEAVKFPPESGLDVLIQVKDVFRVIPSFGLYQAIIVSPVGGGHPPAFLFGHEVDVGAG
jgi:hypothetical protein